MEYCKHCEVKVVRTEHKVKLYIGGSVLGLQQALKNIPIDARLADVEEDRSGHTVLVFKDERKDDSPNR